MISAIYARQSVEKPDSLSIDGQIELCRRECSYPDVQVYQDAGYSGKNTNRPAFEALMRDVEDGKIGQLVCYRLDRISRNVADFGRIWETLSEHKVEFSSVSERFDTSTSIGRAMLYIIMIFAQMEREAIAERVRDNYYQRVKSGAWPGGPAPFGFTIVRRDGQAVLSHTDDISLVREIFSMYLAPGASLGKVAHELTRRGIPCMQRKSWDSVSLARLLHNPAYACCNVDVMRYYQSRGVILYNDLDAFDGSRSAILVGRRSASTRKYSDVTEHLLALTSTPGVIPADDFLAVQRKLDGNRQIKNSGTGQYTWLSGLLKCGCCGYALQVHLDRQYNVLRLTCSGRTRLGRTVCTHRHSEKLEDIEARVSIAIQGYLDRLARSDDDPSTAEQDAAKLDELRLEQAKLEQRIQVLIDGLTDANPVTMRYLNQEITRLDARLREIADALAPASSPLPLDELRSTRFETLGDEEKRGIARALLRSVLCTTDDVSVVWK